MSNLSADLQGAITQAQESLIGLRDLYAQLETRLRETSNQPPAQAAPKSALSDLTLARTNLEDAYQHLTKATRQVKDQTQVDRLHNLMFRVNRLFLKVHWMWRDTCEAN